jgi:hypothetical protein
MRSLLMLLLCVVSLSAFAQRHVDTALYTILTYDDHAKMAMNWQFLNARPDSMTGVQVDSAEELIDSAYASYLRDANKDIHLLQPLEVYHRQYVALINEQGEREIWINFFCGSFGNDWKHSVMVVDDGGGCFFQIRLNWSKKKVVELLPNGVAFNKSYNKAIAPGWIGRKRWRIIVGTKPAIRRSIDSWYEIRGHQC